MFEKEAEEYCGNLDESKTRDFIKDAFKDGAEFGYNKANEWHYVKDGDLPEVDNRIVLCVCGNGYINGKRNHILKLLTRKEFPLFQPVYAWKEIVPPSEPMRSLNKEEQKNYTEAINKVYKPTGVKLFDKE